MKNQFSESMLVNLHLIGYRSVRYSITSPPRRHISKALSLFEDNKLIPSYRKTIFSRKHVLIEKEN